MVWRWELTSLLTASVVRLWNQNNCYYLLTRNLGGRLWERLSSDLTADSPGSKIWRTIMDYSIWWCDSRWWKWKCTPAFVIPDKTLQDERLPWKYWVKYSHIGGIGIRAWITWWRLVLLAMGGAAGQIMPYWWTPKDVQQNQTVAVIVQTTTVVTALPHVLGAALVRWTGGTEKTANYCMNIELGIARVGSLHWAMQRSGSVARGLAYKRMPCFQVPSDSLWWTRHIVNWPCNTSKSVLYLYLQVKNGVMICRPPGKYTRFQWMTDFTPIILNIPGSTL